LLLHKYFEIFDRIFKNILPVLKSKFDKIEFNYLLWLGKWLQTLFTYNFEFSVINKLWDIIIFNNIDYLLLISLAIIDYFKNELISCESLDEIVIKFPALYDIGKENNKEFNKFFTFLNKKINSEKYKSLIRIRK